MVTADRLAGAVPARGPADGAGLSAFAAQLSAAAGRVGRRRDVRLALVLLLTALAVRSALHRHDGLGEPVALSLAVTSTAPLLLARAFPAFGLGLPVLSGAVFITVARLGWPGTAIVAWLLALALCPLYLSRRDAVAALMSAGASVAAALFVPDRINATPWDATVAELLAAMGAWWVGETVRTRRDTRAERAAVAVRLRTLAERDAVAGERARIARELHDVVAHHVSTIAVRAATLPYEVGDLPEPARAGLAEIAEGARAALADLRAVLGVLRTSADEANGAPQPQLADLPTLVARVNGSGSGVRVLLTVGGPQRPLPDSVQVCGYRIVQEALTNAVRHAPGSKVHVELVYTADGLTIAVRDDGPGPGARPEAGSGGHGLIGMRERVAMLGGSLRTGRRPAADGPGFEVVATVPCREAQDRRP